MYGDTNGSTKYNFWNIYSNNLAKNLISTGNLELDGIVLIDCLHDLNKLKTFWVWFDVVFVFIYQNNRVIKPRMTHFIKNASKVYTTDTNRVIVFSRNFIMQMIKINNCGKRLASGRLKSTYIKVIFTTHLYQELENRLEVILFFGLESLKK